MQNVLAFFKEGGEVGNKFIRIYLAGAGVRAVCHCGIELIERDRFAKVVGICLAVKEKVEADIMNIS